MKNSVTLEELLDEAVIMAVEKSVESNDKMVKDEEVKAKIPNALKSILTIQLWAKGLHSPTLCIGDDELKSYGINADDYDMEEEVRKAVQREFDRNMEILKLIK